MLIFNEMMMRSALYKTQHAEVDFYSASSLKQQSRDRHVAPLEHIILIPSQSLLFLLNAACLAEKQHIPILKSLVWPDWGMNPRSTISNRAR